jgi:hypothetical protein
MASGKARAQAATRARMASGNTICAVCNPCPHGKLKNGCAACKAARAGQPPPPRKRKRDPEIKPDPEVKLEPEIKQEPFTIRGYFGIRD